ncbi:MAG: glycosyltransferase family 87 protein [Thermoguttaceae bacterium]
MLTDEHLRRALTLWACLAAAVCVKTAVSPHPRSVYPQFAASSYHWWADKSLYVNYWPTEHIDGYRYSPTFAVAFTPLAYLPAWLGTMIWDVASLVLLVWALHVFVRDVLPGDWPPQRESLFLMLALPGSIVGIWSGQSNAIVIATIMLALAAIVRQRWWWAVILLAVPVFIKLWPLALVMLLVVFWPRQLGWRFAVVCALLALVPFLTRPPSMVKWQYCEWYSTLTGPLLKKTWPGYRDAWTIWATLSPTGTRRTLASPSQRYAYMALQMIAAGGVLYWCWRQYRRQALAHEILLQETLSHCNGGALGCGKHSRERLLLMILSMWASWQLLFGPGTEQLTYGIIAPSASWAVIVSFDEKRARWLTVTAWAMLALFSSGDLEMLVRLVLPAGKILLPLGVVLFAAWLLWHERGPLDREQQSPRGAA